MPTKKGRPPWRVSFAAFLRYSMPRGGKGRVTSKQEREASLKDSQASAS